MKIADWYAVLGGTAEGFEVDCLNGAGVARVEIFTREVLDGRCFHGLRREDSGGGRTLFLGL